MFLERGMNSGKRRANMVLRCTKKDLKDTSEKKNIWHLTTVKMYLYGLPDQHGRVEGRVLISSCESILSATSCCTTINRRMLEPTKKKILHMQRQRRSLSKTVGRVQSQ